MLKAVLAEKVIHAKCQVVEYSIYLGRRNRRLDEGCEYKMIYAHMWLFAANIR